MVATAANVHDSLVLPDLLHSEETRVWGDSVYARQNRLLRAPRSRLHSGQRQPESKADRRGARQKTGTNRAFAHVWNISSALSNGSLASTKSATVGWPKMVIACALSNLAVAKKALLGRNRMEMQGSCA